MKTIEQQIQECRDALPSDLPWRMAGYQLGTFHTPHREHKVTYHPGYGVCAATFVTTNGSLRFLVECFPESTTFTPCQMLLGETQ